MKKAYIASSRPIQNFIQWKIDSKTELNHNINIVIINHCLINSCYIAHGTAHDPGDLSLDIACPPSANNIPTFSIRTLWCCIFLRHTQMFVCTQMTEPDLKPQYLDKYAFSAVKLPLMISVHIMCQLQQLALKSHRVIPKLPVLPL